ncbi:PTS sugar transporter subunit IIC [Deferribacter abyssi]|uniref:PTS sugar transporter subunit IIC n=1 Tax=Deferribacter abyssi TaxID=213806 RepID=UPI003C160CC6
MKYLFLFFLSGLISVDRNSAFNIMVSRPILIALIIGLILGNLTMCLLLGVVFELIGLIDLPVGTHVPRDDSFMCYVGCFMINFVSIDNVFKLFILLLLLIISSYPVTFTDTLTRRLNQGIFLKNKVKWNDFPVTRVLAWGVLISFFRGVIVYNFLFFVIYFVYNQLVVINFNFIFNKYVTDYLILLIFFLSGYLIRFLSFKSLTKYIVFIIGVILGWLVI